MPTIHGTLATDRFALVPMTREDAPKLADLGADPDIVKNLICDWTTAEKRLEIARTWIEHNQKTGIWGVHDREDIFGLPARFIGFCAADKPLRRGGLGPEIYYAFHRKTWGSGVATEAVGALIDRLFLDQGVKAVEALVLAGLNPASVRLLEKLGMGLAGRYPMVASAGRECGPTVRYELWRVETSPPDKARHCLEEAAFKIGQFVAENVASKREMQAALQQACLKNGLVARLGEEAVGRVADTRLTAGMKEDGWLHYRIKAG